MLIPLLGIGESSWSFKTVFEVTEDELRAPNADLVFDGLDTFASVSLVPLLVFKNTEQT